MRKIVAGLFMSLDGVVEQPENWHFPYYNDEMGNVVQKQMADADTLLLGRVSYEGFAEYWSDKGGDGGFGDYFNDTPKLVASRTLDKVEWKNSTLLGSDVVAELTALKSQPGKNISITGSVVLVRSLVQAGILDELSLLIHPIVVGKGQRLFEGVNDTLPLKLIESTTFSTGVVNAVYGPADPVEQA